MIKLRRSEGEYELHETSRNVNLLILFFNNKGQEVFFFYIHRIYLAVSIA